MGMTIDKPGKDLKRVILTAADRDAGQTKSITIYNTSPARVIEICTEAIRNATGNAGSRRAKVRPSAV